MADTNLYDDFSEGGIKASGKVTCLGLSFDSEEERRNYFTEKLREKLRDPEFRKIEGFPIGSDDDILHLSDPPYYTACPNPWISDFIKEWEAQKPEQPMDYKYHREPFAADVSEGKNDPIYNAHSYHTKVPHKAIMRYILHYTEPGDIVFDGFCGTGMTGVAAQMCGDRKTVESLGYQVKPDGTIMQQETGEDGKTCWVPFSKLGVRKAVLNDLSPAATFIAYNYNTPVDVKEFEMEAKRILKEVEDECGWMYETKHIDGRIGKINYTVWSDVFVCPECANEVIFREAAVDKEVGGVKDEFPCPHCSSNLSKRNMERAWVTKYDSAIKETIRHAKQVPVMVNYSVEKKKFEKVPDDFDLELIDKIEHSEIPYWFPRAELPDGYNLRQPKSSHGLIYVHHFYTKRNLWILAALLQKTSLSNQKAFCRFLFQQWAVGFSKLNRYSPTHFSQNNRNLTGTLYVGSQLSEVSPQYAFENKLKRIVKCFEHKFVYSSSITTQDASKFFCQGRIADYIFIDPPFGSNIMYSELNFLWESWTRIRTNNKPEAIENEIQGKGLDEYRNLMTACYKEAYRILKPGRWMTVEFSNTKASVWNSIQTALSEAGFIIANISALDKKQGSFKAVTTPTAVKQDLVISAYKPNGGFEDRFSEEATTEKGVWDFVRTHLEYLPVTKYQGSLLQLIPERDPRILFDQMVAYYVRKGYPVPISSQEFQVGLGQRFIERDGMYFLPEQAAEYDRKKLTSGQLIQTKLFVSDESSAIQWLRQLLKAKPQTFQDINPQFMQELGGWSKNEQQLDLRELLNQNFLSYNGIGDVPSQIHSYLSSNWQEMRNRQKDDPELMTKAKDRWYVPDPNKAGDLEKLREKSLLKEFEEYKQAKKKLKVFRMEAVRAGFKKAWQERDYSTIIKVADLIPNNVLEEDPKLLMWYDQAVTRVGGE
ncbi:DNA methyltransferase [Methanomethylovorans sp.]|uniref:DNA methyltransferase n=1 Tax=Methanomethylovorans sp. TaxID=2758717 RepID=UPI00345E4F24